MKIPHSSRPAQPTPRGVALVIVLSMLVLLSALLVAFMTTASTERSASFANAGVANSRQIADSTVSYVISQIRDATSVPEDNVIWASQPGAIRTFAGTITPGGTKNGSLRDGAYWDDYNPSSATIKGGRPAEAVYKLYSSDRMLVSAQDYANISLDPSKTDSDLKAVENWQALKPALNEKDYPDYVDLNQPILSPRRDIAPDGTVVEPRYPIIDPRAKLNPSTNAEGSPGAVDGFDAKLTFDDPKTLDMVKLDGKSAAKVGVPYLPLPVKWLYVLRDGTMGPASLATETNPIVGRTAFWTDDESCKLNINTASEGTFWDTPSVSSMQEMGKFAKGGVIGAVDRGLNLSASQPIHGEYQRYSGHPATTSLSPALGWLWGISSAPGAGSTPVGPYTTAENTAYNKFKEAIYKMSPYTPSGLGTSQGATHNTDFEADTDGKLIVKTKHLYASVDDMIFKSGRFSSGGTPDLNVINPEVTAGSQTPLPTDLIERVRFFLTTSSRAPELNLLSRPRVTMWPVNALAKYRTAFDDLFVFTSTLAKAGGTNTVDQRYCFLRGDAKDASADFTGNFPKLGVTDGRNQKLYEYLQNQTSQPVPGFSSKSFEQKWGQAERDEILLLIEDYIRTVDLSDTGTTTRTNSNNTTNAFAPYTPRFFYKAPPPDQYQRYDRSYDWSGQVTPLRNPNPTGPSNYQGMGRFIIPSEVAIVFHGTTPPPNSPAGTLAMRATLVIEMSTTMPGYPAIRETFWTRLIPKRATKIKVGTTGSFQSYNFCGDDLATPGNTTYGVINVNNVSSHETGQGRGYMPNLGLISWMFHFPEHKAPTFTAVNALEGNPPIDPNRIGTVGNPVAKLFMDTTDPRCKNVDSNGTLPYGYVREKNAAGGIGTTAIYPYTSKPIVLPTVAAQRVFSFQGGAFDLEIWSGEAPDDTRSQLVQTVQIDFPKDVTVPASGTFPCPVNGVAGDFSTRLSDGGLEASTNIIIANTDIVRSMELTTVANPGTPATLNQSGDLRLAAGLQKVPPDYYFPRDGTTRYTSTTAIIHGLCRGHGDPQTGHTGVGLLAPSGGVRGSKPPILPFGVNGVIRADTGPGDWDRGLSKHEDGSFGNKVDEGNLKYDYSGGTDHTVMPYYRGRGIEETGQTFFTPNRMMPSAVMLGSIPTGVVSRKPWQTLLFRPNREVATLHPGADTKAGPPDHLVLDLFHMPVVEPYAISEPFSTAGKVNMNYVIAPFGYAKGGSGTDPDSKQVRSYVKRDTGLRGVIKSTYMMAVPTGQGEGGHDENIEGVTTPFRFPVDANRTLEELEARLKYKQGQYPLFRSASEICTVDLYPKSVTGAAAPTVNGWDAFWKANALTGDNMRERPYAHIYPRLTTKSNVYTVHMRCQAIRKSANSKATEFDPRLDSVVGEYRGSATIERFIDPNDEALKNYDAKNSKVDSYYRYRVVNTKMFAPK